MASLRNSENSWGLVALLIHWLMALALTGLIVFGLLMVNAFKADGLDASVFGMGIYDAFQTHKSFGLTLFALVLFRMVWRAFNPPPKLPDDMPAIERLAAHAGHLALYFLMIAIPVSGWLMASSSPWEIPTYYFGLFQVWHPLGPDEAMETLLKRVHFWLSMGLVFTVATHIVAALKHHFINKDEVLSRMAPFISKPR